MPRPKGSKNPPPKVAPRDTTKPFAGATRAWCRCEQPIKGHDGCLKCGRALP